MPALCTALASSIVFVAEIVYEELVVPNAKDSIPDMESKAFSSIELGTNILKSAEVPTNARVSVPFSPLMVSFFVSSFMLTLIISSSAPA